MPSRTQNMLLQLLSIYKRRISMLISSATSMLLTLLKWQWFTHRACADLQGAFNYHGLTSVPAGISNFIHYKVWDQITYPFADFSGRTIESWEWISNFISHFTGHMNTYAQGLCFVVLCCGLQMVILPISFRTIFLALRQYYLRANGVVLWPLLVTWINCNPSMDK